MLEELFDTVEVFSQQVRYDQPVSDAADSLDELCEVHLMVPGLRQLVHLCDHRQVPQRRYFDFTEVLAEHARPSDHPDQIVGNDISLVSAGVSATHDEALLNCGEL